VAAVDRDRDSVSRGSSAAIVITDTTDAADATSVDAADSAAVVDKEVGKVVAALNSRAVRAANRASARHSLR